MVIVLEETEMAKLPTEKDIIPQIPEIYTTSVYMQYQTL